MAEDAQKSEAHETTDDAGTSPASNFERGSAEAKVRPDADFANEPPGRIGGGAGAGDASSGGGGGAGIPGGGTDMRLGDAAPQPGDPDEDRAKLFPEGT